MPSVIDIHSPRGLKSQIQTPKVIIGGKNQGYFRDSNPAGIEQDLNKSRYSVKTVPGKQVANLNEHESLPMKVPVMNTMSASIDQSENDGVKIPPHGIIQNS